MGLIVVNQTDAKQSIVLESTPEGVTGGYYDQEGNWNEFGGGGGDKSLFYAGDMVLGHVASNVTGDNYWSENAKRCCTKYFCLIKPGSYKLKVNGNLENLEYSVFMYKQSALDKVYAHQLITTDDRYFSDYKSMNDLNFDVPENMCALKLAIKKTDESDFDVLPFTEVMIEENL